jgi:signal transduction histidine kinase
VIRRLLGAFLLLIVVVLAGAVLPLGLQTAAQYRRDYAAATLGQARAIASVMEERLADHESEVPPKSQMRRLLDPRQGVALVNRSGRVTATAGIGFAVPHGLASGKVVTATEPGVAGESGLLVAAPVGFAQHSSGRVVLARSTEPLEGRIHDLWLTLAGVAITACLIAVGLAWSLSRWVSAPLRRLERAAREVGSGTLDARVGAVAGPVEARRLAATFDTMAARLDSLVAGHRSVIADVSHQLRTPLSALRLRLELLFHNQVEPSPESQGVLDELGRLSRLLDGLLTVARAEAATAAAEQVDLCKAVADRLEVWAPLALERGVELRLDSVVDTDAWVVRDHLDQILDNLLGNCFDLEPPPTLVRVRISGDGQMARISLADDGPGMSYRQREVAFRRFTTDRKDSGGTGLGLSIVHGLVTANGGTVSLEETPGGGLTVVIKLDRALQIRPKHPPQAVN